MTSWMNKDKWECAKRELTMRVRVYGRRVQAGEMTEQASAREISLMSAIVEDYQKLVEQEQLDLFKDAV